MASNCPACKSDTVKPLENLTEDTEVRYIRCEACGHVWVEFADGSVHHVTPLSEKAS